MPRHKRNDDDPATTSRGMVEAVPDDESTEDESTEDEAATPDRSAMAGRENTGDTGDNEG